MKFKLLISLYLLLSCGSLLSAQSITHQITLPNGMTWCEDSKINALADNINAFRTQNGRSALARDSVGMKAAEMRAVQFAQYMATHSPGSPGFNPHEGYDTTAASLGYNLVSENLAYLTNDPNYIVYGGWQGSLHRAALLASDANVMGVSCIYWGSTPFWTYEPGISQNAPPAPTPTPASAPASTPSAQASTLDSEQWAFLTLINNFRAQNGAGPLKVSALLHTASQWMSNDLATKNYFSHTDSLGRSTGARLAFFGYTYSPWGENIAAGYSDAQNTFNQWLTACDPDASGACTYAHRKNMLYAGFKAIGIGRVFNTNSPYGWYWTTDFGGFVEQEITPGGTPAPAPTPAPVPVPAISQFRATPSTMTAGQSTVLTWSLTGATSVSINNGVGTVTNLTSRTVSPTQTTTYILTATNGSGSSTAQATVTVSAPAPAVDTQPPSAPTITSAAATSSTQINLAWTASTDNVGVTGYQIFRNGAIRATVGASPLAFSDTGVSAGTTYSYTIKAYDARGNLSASSNSASAATPAPAPVVTTCPGPATQAFTACYYGNTVVTGGLLHTRTEPQVNLDGPPSAAVPASVFSARWKGNFTFAQGNYTFNAITADGMAIYIDGALVLNAWMDQPTTAYSVVKSMTAGQHLIQVDYFQRHNKTSAHLSWQQGGQSTQPQPTADSQAPTAPSLTSAVAKSSTEVGLTWIASTDNKGVTGYQIFRNGSALTTVNALSYSDKGVGANGIYAYMVKAFDTAGNVSAASNTVQVATPGTPGPDPSPAPAPIACGTPATNAFTGCYYGNATLTGSPVLSRVDSLVNFDWGMATPDPSISSSSYSVRWQGSFTFGQGEHGFTAITAGGMRLYIDGVLVLDAWRDQPVTSYMVLKTMSAGQHLITVEYYRQSGMSSAHLSWVAFNRTGRR